MSESCIVLTLVFAVGYGLSVRGNSGKIGKWAKRHQSPGATLGMNMGVRIFVLLSQLIEQFA